MRKVCVASGIALLLIAAASSADDAVPEVVVKARPSAGSCVAPGVDNYACVNADLTALVARQQTEHELMDGIVAGGLPQSAPGQGLYNQTAMRIRMGGNFGRSVYPQRPPQPSYRPPLIH
ncbi:hypothetical protein [Solimonas flava]|uniref:hypothetical protein n=1 Tax=Solimonas flava TaxID=415849 RepID=UPI000400456F|nr:hypothetical protein [Solimonas flava]